MNRGSLAPRSFAEAKTRRGLHQKPFGSSKPAGDCAKNRFGAQNPARIAPKTNLKPKTSLGLGQKRNLSLRRGSFWAKNRFEARGEGHFGLKIDLKPAARVISRQKQDLGLGRPSFHISTHKQINKSTGLQPPTPQQKWKSPTPPRPCSRRAHSQRGT